MNLEDLDDLDLGDLRLFVEQFQFRHAETWAAYLELVAAIKGVPPRTADRMSRQFRKQHPAWNELLRGFDEGPEVVRATWSRLQ